MKVYIVPAITDKKILPTSTIPSQYISNKISLTGCRGQYIPASFVVQADTEELTSLIVEASGFIPSANIDIRVVKCWYQSGVEINDTKHKLLTPELLLKDDSLVKVEGGENYLKLTSGEYIWISDPDGIPGVPDKPTMSEFPVQDNPLLQPVDIPKGTSKQFWVTVKVPDDAIAGIYTGKIELRTSAGNIGEIQLNLEVLPIELLEPYLIYSLYYPGRFDSYWPEGSISDSFKSEEQFRNETENLLNHGVTNPVVYQNVYRSYDEELLGKVLTIRDEMGMGNQPLYYLGLEPWGYQDIDEVKEVIAFAESYGIPQVYFYGDDEAKGQELLDQRESWQAIREAGGKIFVAGVRVGYYPDYPSSEGNFGLMGDIQDLLICYGPPHAEEAARWHSVGHQIFCYSNPQVGEETPETYRRNFGLLLWQGDYDGAMDFAYQYGFGNIWNDFDYEEYRDHVFAYPTIDGVIDTIQWEGWREGVDDIRYLTTLLESIEEAKAAGKGTSSAEAWLADLKNSDLTAKDLDAVRSEIINHILAIQTGISEQTVDLAPGESKVVSFEAVPHEPGTYLVSVDGLQGNFKAL